jgi:hypothetical protein
MPPPVDANPKVCADAKPQPITSKPNARKYFDFATRPSFAAKLPSFNVSFFGSCVDFLFGAVKSRSPAAKPLPENRLSQNRVSTN